MERINDMIRRLRGLTPVTVSETQRVLVIRNGRFETILTPGKHWLRARDLELHEVSLERHRFTSPFDEALKRTRPDLTDTHLVEFRTDPGEVAVILRDGRPEDVLLPEGRVTYWRDAGPWEAERHALADGLEVDRDLATRLERLGTRAGIARFSVERHFVGLLFVDGALTGRLEAGPHAFWDAGHKLALRQVDMRQRSHEVTGQEILTRDRVTVRVNLTAAFRVTDPERAITAVQDFEEELHRAVQLAFRRTLGAKTLDALLEEKVTVDAEAAKAVREQMARIGVEVGDIALKDVILPGEMREILNQVVAAQKEAEANVIRRREETNATRSLLNTAKVMAENPVMLRLKELEALETISGRVERLTVHNGTAGLMSDLVRLTD